MLTRQSEKTVSIVCISTFRGYFNPFITIRLLALAGLFFLNLNLTKAQVSLSFHIGTGPRWAPAAYSRTTRYYYFPEYDLYFDALRNGYYYNEGQGWFFTPQLPFGFHEANLYTTEKVVINYYGDHPYNHFSSHRLIYVERYHPAWRNHGYFRPGKPLRPGIPPVRPVRPVKPHEGYRPSKPQIQPPRPVTHERPQIQPPRPVSPARPQVQPSRPVSPGRPAGMNGSSRPGSPTPPQAGSRGRTN